MGDESTLWLHNPPTGLQTARLLGLPGPYWLRFHPGSQARRGRTGNGDVRPIRQRQILPYEPERLPERSWSVEVPIFHLVYSHQSGIPGGGSSWRGSKLPVPSCAGKNSMVEGATPGPDRPGHLRPGTGPANCKQKPSEGWASRKILV